MIHDTENDFENNKIWRIFINILDVFQVILESNSLSINKKNHKCSLLNKTLYCVIDRNIKIKLNFSKS